MRPFHPVSLAEQLATHLKAEILQGMLIDTVPGVHKLAAALGVHHTIVEEALRLLENQGLIESQGAGRRRRIRSTENFVPPSMRIAILPYESTDRTVHYILDMQHKLQAAGHVCGVVSKTLQELEMDADRVARFVKNCEADAWVVIAGPRGVLEWFAKSSIPAFSLFGRRRNIPIASAGPDKLPAMLQALDRLVELGHQRIVMLLREEHRKPVPGFVAEAMLSAMQSHGLKTGSYNLPDWKNQPDDLRRCLDSLFQITPPSALIIDESFLFNVVQQHLACLGILTPRDVSLVCADPDPCFDWYRPSISHVHWDSGRVVQRVVRWANNVARRKPDIQQTLVKAMFVEGGSIGPAPGKHSGLVGRKPPV